MKLSGFTFVKNGAKLFFPVKESILSILPIVDEFVIALGDNDPDDTTRDEIMSIGSDKIKIIDTVWRTEDFPRNTELARQTDIARKACTGDWLFYLQSDEVMHEEDLPKVKAACEKYKDNPNVEGLLFKYRHFWGDFDHYHNSHGWYPREIRVIKNLPDIHSWKDAQSFRHYFKFEETPDCYSSKEVNRKLNVVELDAYINHYGWVRPPHIMGKKTKKMDLGYSGKNHADAEQIEIIEMDYGPLNLLPKFKGQHPAVMKDWIARLDWQDKLYFDKKTPVNRPLHNHERPKYRILTFLEQNFFGGREIGGFKNYNKVKD